jgi:uncharacterized membrane protein YeiB
VTSPPGSSRLLGIDLARFVALAGMVLVHAQSDLVLPPLEAAAGGTEVRLPAAPALLELVQAVATNRARLLFLLLAGIGVALLSRRGPRTATLLRRAAFLFVLGVLLLALGWSDLVLLFYGVVFLLAPVLLRLQTPALLAVAALSALPAVVGTALDPAREADFTGVLLVVGEAVPCFCIGLAVGRADLRDRGVVRRLAAAGAVLAAPGLLLLAVRGGLDLTDVDGARELAAATTSTIGLCLLILAACLRLCAGRPPRALRLLAGAGGMPLTAYVGHALLFPLLAGRAQLDLVRATAVAVTYLVVVVLGAHAWRRRYGSGPVEAVLRRLTGS